jgi:hypothetical protein
MMRALQMTRGVTTFAIRTRDLKDGRVLLEMINFLDAGIFRLPINYLNVAIFLQGVIQRLQKAMTLTIGDNEEDWITRKVQGVVQMSEVVTNRVVGKENVDLLTRKVL